MGDDLSSHFYKLVENKNKARGLESFSCVRSIVMNRTFEKNQFGHLFVRCVYNSPAISEP